MKKLFVLVLTSIFLTTSASAAVDMFLKIDGIEGESDDTQHLREVDVSAWSFNILNGGGKDACTDGLQITKTLDKSSVKFAQAAGDKTLLGPAGYAWLAIRSTGDFPLEFLELAMEGVKVVAYQISGSDDQGKPLETITLRFDWIQ
ncbi:MAG: hypothetical protein GQ538_12570, partial [Xanthomonadales bacterium]|nr:hypothetical protein [Xanthomonadales bacterium]